AAMSLPEWRFDIRMFCFDDRVYETSLESKKLFGFGGTSFGPLESYIQKHKGKEYPRAVFVITDGYGTPIKPEIPQRWYWFLSSSYTGYIPKTCNIFKLKDFE
ncbi:MAG: hypothetical protein JXN60_06135, partial [Lentisphaerae bacterium]|nr:hypothetical protein [Lentisphaerota bacterium]